jgi:hypothetical protein
MVRPVYSNVSVCLKNEEIEEKVEICGAEAVCVESPSHTINNSMDDTEHHCESCAQEEDHDVLSVLYHSRRVIDPCRMRITSQHWIFKPAFSPTRRGLQRHNDRSVVPNLSRRQAHCIIGRDVDSEVIKQSFGWFEEKHSKLWFNS